MIEQSLEQCGVGKLTHDRGLVTGWRALISFVRLWKNCHEECHSSVVIEDSKQEPDSPEDNQSILVETDDEDGGHGGDHQQVLAHVQAPVLVTDVVQDDVRERVTLRVSVVCKCKAERCHQKPSPQEETGKESLQWLLWYFISAF